MSAHIIPVRILIFSALWSPNPEPNYVKKYPISLSLDGEYETLLAEKNVTFTLIDDGDNDAPEWSRVLLDGSVRLTGVKEVSMTLIIHYGWGHLASQMQWLIMNFLPRRRPTEFYTSLMALFCSTRLRPAIFLPRLSVTIPTPCNTTCHSTSTPLVSRANR